MTDIRDEYDDLHVGKNGIPLVKRKDGWARSAVRSWSDPSGIRRRQAMYDRVRRDEPSLPKFKCLED